MWSLPPEIVWLVLAHLAPPCLPEVPEGAYGSTRPYVEAGVNGALALFAGLRRLALVCKLWYRVVCCGRGCMYERLGYYQYTRKLSLVRRGVAAVAGGFQTYVNRPLDGASRGEVEALFTNSEVLRGSGCSILDRLVAHVEVASWEDAAWLYRVMCQHGVDPLWVLTLKVFSPEGETEALVGFSPERLTVSPSPPPAILSLDLTRLARLEWCLEGFGDTRFPRLPRLTSLAVFSTHPPLSCSVFVDLVVLLPHTQLRELELLKMVRRHGECLRRRDPGWCNDPSQTRRFSRWLEQVLSAPTSFTLLVCDTWAGELHGTAPTAPTHNSLRLVVAPLLYVVDGMVARTLAHCIDACSPRHLQLCFSSGNTMPPRAEYVFLSRVLQDCECTSLALVSTVHYSAIDEDREWLARLARLPTGATHEWLVGPWSRSSYNSPSYRWPEYLRVESRELQALRTPPRPPPLFAGFWRSHGARLEMEVYG